MTATLPSSSATADPGAAPVAVAAPGRTRRGRSTPQTLTTAGAVLALVSVLFGVMGVLTVRGRADASRDMVTRSGPLTVNAQEIYRALSDADATAAGAFLAGGLEPPAARNRYLQDIAQATAALSDAATDAGDADATRRALATLSAQLPVYTGLIETARTNNRQGFPLGAAYLREASGLMRSTLLPAAAQLYEMETTRLADDQDRATGFPWAMTLLGLLLLVGLVMVQRYLTRRTNRVMNLGLVAATAAVAMSLLWAAVAFHRQGSDLDESSRDGSAQVTVLARARFAALEARADESLTLVARGDGAVYQKDFERLAATLGDKNGGGGLLERARTAATDATGESTTTTAAAEYAKWLASHQQVRKLDDGGDYDKAVDLAIGSSPDGAATAFSKLDAALAQAIEHGRQRFDQAAARARGALSGAVYVLSLLALLAAGSAVLGIRQRLREYR